MPHLAWLDDPSRFDLSSKVESEVGAVKLWMALPKDRKDSNARVGLCYVFPEGGFSASEATSWLSERGIKFRNLEADRSSTVRLGVLFEDEEGGARIDGVEILAPGVFHGSDFAGKPITKTFTEDDMTRAAADTEANLQYLKPADAAPEQSA